VSPGDEVRINGELVKVRFAEPRARVLIYHKPAGELVTRDDPEGRPTVFEKLPSIGNGKWINVGRLDYNTEGLLLFTNSGELANRLMHPRYEVEREYAVRIMGRMTDEQMQALTTGIALDDGPARCEKVSDGGGDEDGANHWYHVVLKEGRNREVRRLFEALGVMVSRLIRTRYGTVAMPTHLKRGNVAELEAPDVASIIASAGLQSTPDRAPQQERRNARSGRPDSRKGSHPAGARPAHKQGPPRPQGQGAPRPNPQALPRAPGAAQPRPAQGPARAHAPGGPRPHGPPGGPRPHGKRGMGPARPQGQGSGRPAYDGAPRPPGNGPRPSRPPGERHNFDEVQPQSNANAAPFGRTLSAPGGAPRGYGNDSGPRHRSGPRAPKGGHGNPNGGYGNSHGNAPSRTYAGAEDKRQSGGPGARAPGRVAPRVEVRYKGVRHEGNVRIAPKPEASGNVAPAAEKPQVRDDDD
jgi:23S rRNA pseudouridine2605 synthase